MAGEVYKEVSLDKLRLDPENPRLPIGRDWGLQSEQEFLREFHLRYNLVELARSFADKGFTPRHAEALLVVEDPSGPDHYLVVEGNRRLATLKLLTNASNRSAVGIKSQEWEDLAEQANFLNPDAIPIIVYPSRGELNDYLGFRHITGPAPWRPEAKARFIAKLLREDASVGDVARRIGTNHRTVRRYSEAHAIYTQALAADIPMDEVEKGFGVFYNALDWEGVRNLLRLGPQTAINKLPESPVPVESLDNLRDVIGLLYGDSPRGLERVIRESRDLGKLSQVLGNEVARMNLLRDRDLERAWRVSGGGKTELLALVADLYSRLAEVNGKAREYSEDADVGRGVRRIYELVIEMGERYKVGSP